MLLTLALSCVAVPQCVGAETGLCGTPSGAYRALVPEDWDGETALPVVFIFHGHNGHPDNFADDDSVRQAFSDHGVLLVVPEGKRNSWAVTPLSGLRRDEVAFAEEVLDDVSARFVIDEDRVFASGFSIGGSVVYQLGCDSERFTGLAPMSGGFWIPVPEQCSTDPVPLHHLHGERDTTWPVEGQAFLPGVGHAPLADNLALWTAHNRCGTATGEYTSDDGLRCVVWTDCDAPVERCLHDGGHARPDGWVEAILARLLSPP